MVTQSHLQSEYVYLPETGVFIRKLCSKAIRYGLVAGYETDRGYRRVKVMGKAHYVHKLAWLYVYGVYPDQIDHINGDKLDNRIANLRLATTAENKQNMFKARRDSKTGVLGVYEHKGRYRAHIRVNGKGHWLGSFDTKDAAAEAYAAAKRQLHSFAVAVA